MKNLLRGQRGFSLIEVVAAANAKLHNDLAAIDQAIQLYRLDEGKVPAALTALDKNYLNGKLEFKDAKGETLTYTPDTAGGTYTLSGKDSKGATVTSSGSATNGTPGNSEGQ